MYSIVLAAALSVGGAEPGFGFGGCYNYGCWGCHGWGCCGCSCFGGWGYCGCNCYSCGCCGCCGCWGCGCWGGHGCFGCCGCYGCYSGCWSCWSDCYCSCSCVGCFSCAYAAPVILDGTPVVPSISTQPIMPTLPTAPKEKQKESRGDGPARVIVKAPADSSVTVEGQPVTLDGTQQTFNTPTLKAGHTYTYTFKVQAVREGRTFTRTENVTVRAGSESFVDLSELVAEEDRPARVTVLLPADAKLFVDKVRCPLTTERRSFETPTLQASKTYYYTIRAEVVRDGRTITISERASLTAGKHVVVDLNEKITVQAARR